MSWIPDLLKDIPLSAVLREKMSIIEAKYEESETEKASLKDDLREAKAEIGSLRKQIEQLIPKTDLEDIEVELLDRMAHRNYDEAVPANLARSLDLSPARIDYHIERLVELGYAKGGVTDARFIHYEVTQPGRAFLKNRNLL